jgi:hypothetical protein
MSAILPASGTIATSSRPATKVGASSIAPEASPTLHTWNRASPAGCRRHIERELAAENPAAYEPDLARTLNNLGALYDDAHRFANAEAALKEVDQLLLLPEAVDDYVEADADLIAPVELVSLARREGRGRRRSPSCSNALCSRPRTSSDGVRSRAPGNSSKIRISRGP